MQIGLLWYDDDPQRPLEAKIGRAADRYREKYGRLPDTCYVHPQAIDADGHPAGSVQLTVPLGGVPIGPVPRGKTAAGRGAHPAQMPPAGSGTVRLVSAPFVLRHHFWVGENTGS